MWFWGGTFTGSSLIVAALVLGLTVWSAHRRGEGLRDLGIRFDNFGEAVYKAAAITLPVMALTLAAGVSMGRLRPDWLVVAVRMPWLICWGFLQQFALQGFVHRRLAEIFASTRRREGGTALVFALCHLPNVRLMAATLAGGWVWAWLYRRRPNLLALALSHAFGSAAVSIAFGPDLMHGMRVGKGYFLYQHMP